MKPKQQIDEQLFSFTETARLLKIKTSRLHELIKSDLRVVYLGNIDEPLNTRNMRFRFGEIKRYIDSRTFTVVTNN